MKKILLLLSCAIPSLLFAQTSTTSILDGNWSNPTIWSNGIPASGDTVSINTNVTLDTDYTTANGILTIEAGASLTDDATGRTIMMTGLELNNNGETEVDTIIMRDGTLKNTASLTSILIENDGTINNSGTLEADRIDNNNSVQNNDLMTVGDLVTDGALDNFSRLNITDSLINGTFANNYTSGIIDAVFIVNNGFFTNDDSISFGELTNTATYGNYGNSGGDNLYNQASFVNGSNSNIWVTTNFLNSTMSGTAEFTNDGNLSVGNNWVNEGIIQGAATGYFTVTNTSTNSGTMTGDFIFCDLSAPASAPYIDSNSGTIDSTVIFCQTVSVVQTNLLEGVTLFPNPTKGNIYISSTLDEYRAEVYNSIGQLIQTQQNTLEISLADQPAGNYLIKIIDLKEKKYHTEQIQKQ